MTIYLRRFTNRLSENRSIVFASVLADWPPNKAQEIVWPLLSNPHERPPVSFFYKEYPTVCGRYNRVELMERILNDRREKNWRG
jgi:hypothetical protein